METGRIVDQVGRLIETGVKTAKVRSAPARARAVRSRVEAARREVLARLGSEVFAAHAEGELELPARLRPLLDRVRVMTRKVEAVDWYVRRLQETGEDVVPCPACEEEVPIGAVHCSSCGESLGAV